MDKNGLILNNKVSNISIESRRKMVLTGVMEVLTFNEEKIILKTVLGKMSIKGKNLKMNKLDVKNGDVIVEGYICSLVYNNKEKKMKKGFKKFFKRKE